MTPRQQLAALFAPFLGSANTIPWLARELLDLAARAGDIALPGPDGPDDFAGLNRRLFRPLLAAVAHAAAADAGTEFDPYHGRYTLTRSGGLGAPVRLDIAIENTPAEQSLHVLVSNPAEPRPARPAPAPAADHLAPIA